MGRFRRPGRDTLADAKARDVLGDADARNGRTAIAAAPSEIAVLYKEYVGPLTASLTKAFGSGPPDPEDISHLAFQKVIERGDITSIK